jgi:hypothetical protein
MKQIIIDWLFDNRKNLVFNSQNLINEYNMLLKIEDRMFFSKISDQFANRLREYISIEAGKSLGISAADIMECLEDLNLELFINGN